jgi:hypothetical protein
MDRKIFNIFLSTIFLSISILLQLGRAKSIEFLPADGIVADAAR